MITRIAYEPYRFYVASDSNPEVSYLVDLEEYAGNGSCTCQHFMMKMAHRLENSEHPAKPEELKCKHIIRAFIFFGQTTIVGRAIATRNQKKK